MAVIGLIFNAGYLAGGGNELVRVDLCDEAKRLARLVIELLPGEAEAAALGALLCMQDARRAARVGADGHALTHEEQDRGMWIAVKFSLDCSCSNVPFRWLRPARSR